MRAPAKKTRHTPGAERAPRVVYTHAPITLATVVGRAPAGFTVRSPRGDRALPCDPSVDPRLLDEAITTGARVVVDEEAAAIVGVLATARALTLDRDGDLVARVGRFAITADREALLATPASFLRLARGEAELYAPQVLARARELVSLLGRMIKLN